MDIQFYHPQDGSSSVADDIATPGFSILETDDGVRRAYRCFEGKIPRHSDEQQVSIEVFDFLKGMYLIKAAPHIGAGFYNLTESGKCFAYAGMLPRLTVQPINLALVINGSRARIVESPSGDLAHILYLALGMGGALSIEITAFTPNKSVNTASRLLRIDDAGADRFYGWPILPEGS